VNEQDDRVRPRVLWQAQVPELQWTRPIRDAVIRGRGRQRGDAVERERSLSRRGHGHACRGQREERGLERPAAFRGQFRGAGRQFSFRCGRLTTNAPSRRPLANGRGGIEPTVIERASIARATPPVTASRGSPIQTRLVASGACRAEERSGGSASPDASEHPVV